MGKLGKVRMASGDSVSLISLPPAPELGDAEFLVPRAGTYVAFQLDAVHMVEPLEDPELTAAAQRLSARKYLGYVYHVEEFPMPFREDHKCSIELVGRGLCKENKAMFVDSTMCTPIFPATDHPLSREPLRPTPSFPFPGCYQYTAPAPIVRIPTGGYKLSRAVSLGDRDFMADTLYVDEDRTRRRVRRAAKEKSLTQSKDSGSLPTLASSSATSPLAKEPANADTASADAFPMNKLGATACDARCQAWADAVADSDASGDPPIVEALEVASTASNSCPSDQLAPQADACSRSLPRSVQSVPEQITAAHCNAATEPTGSPRLPSSLHVSEDEDEDDAASDLLSDNGSAEDLMQIFVDPFPGEDRLVIPLVRASLDLSEVDEVNDPALFLEEVKEIKHLIEESRSRSQSLRSSLRDRSSSPPPEIAASSVQAALGSWVDLALDTSEVVGSQPEPSKFHRLFNGARYQLRLRARRTRRRCAAFLRMAKTLVTSYPAADSSARLSTR